MSRTYNRPRRAVPNRAPSRRGVDERLGKTGAYLVSMRGERFHVVADNYEQAVRRLECWLIGQSRERHGAGFEALAGGPCDACPADGVHQLPAIEIVPLHELEPDAPVWREHDENETYYAYEQRVTDFLRGKGYAVEQWRTAERDSFGPLSRVVLVTGADDEPVRTWYG